VDDVLGFGAQGGDDVHVAAEYGVPQHSLLRGGVLPGGEARAVLLALGDLVDLLQHALRTHPGMRQAVYDQQVVAGGLGGPDQLDEGGRGVGVQLHHIEIKLVGVFRSRTALRVDDGDPAGLAHQRPADGQGRIGLAAAGRPLQGAAEPDGSLGCAREWHGYSSSCALPSAGTSLPSMTRYGWSGSIPSSPTYPTARRMR